MCLWNIVEIVTYLTVDICLLSNELVGHLPSTVARNYPWQFCISFVLREDVQYGIELEREEKKPKLIYVLCE